MLRHNLLPSRGCWAVALAFISGAVCAQSQRASHCFFDSGMGATFDLSPLSQSASYHVRDSQAGDSDVRNYTYVFNVCGNTADFPRAGPDGSSCKSTTGTEPGPREVMHDPAPAFQIANWGNQVCYRLGNNGSSPDNVEWSLLDPTDPWRGVRLTYKNGNKCGDGSRRQLSLIFECADDAYNVPDVERVAEVSTCHYELRLRSIYGCPMECNVNARRLCSGNGVCRFDTDANAPRCFCNTGYAGNDCSRDGSDNESHGGMVAALIIAIVMLVATLSGMYMVWRKVQSLRLDPSAYTALADTAAVESAP